MATFKATLDHTISLDDSVIVVTWSNLAASGDIGDTQSLPAWADKTFIVAGTFTGTPTVVIEGSNNGIDWVTLSNRQGTAMSFTALGMNTSQDKPVYVRPRLTAGTGGAAVVVSCACHRSDLPGMNLT